MNLKEQIIQFFDLAQELEEICVNDGFLPLVEQINKEQDEDDKYNLYDVLSFVSDVEFAIKHHYTNMDAFYEDY